MQVGNNYLNDSHLPHEISRIDGRSSFNSVSQRPCLTPGSHSVLWSSWCHLRRKLPRRSGVGGRPWRMATAWSWGCMQSGQSTHKTRPHLVRPLWLVPRNWSSCYVCVVASVAAASNDCHCVNYRCAGV